MGRDIKYNRNLLPNYKIADFWIKIKGNHEKKDKNSNCKKIAYVLQI